MVFVTGATGLIGSYLLLELSRRGKKIRAMKRANSPLESVQELFEEFSGLDAFQKIEWIETDLLDIPSLMEALSGIETIYHTAASVGFDDRSRSLIHEINVTGTENLVNLAISLEIPEFIYISSIAVLDKLPHENWVTENSKWDPERPHSEYAISKKKGEMTVWRGSQEGLNVLVAYPSVVIGSQNGSRASEKLFELSLKKKAYASHGLTGYVDVRDVAFCLTELVEQEKWNQLFLLTSEDKSFLEIFDLVRKKRNLSPTKVLSKSKLKFVRFISQFSKWFGGPYMSKSSYLALTGNSRYSNQKIKDTIRIEFIPVEESLDFHSKRYENKLKSITP